MAVRGITANNKTYDGTTTASLNTNNAVLVGNSGGVSLNTRAATGAFIDPNAGTKTVMVSGLTLNGAGAGNYRLIQPITTANITLPRQLSLEVDKRDLPLNGLYGKQGGQHFGITINDNWNQYNGTWDFNFNPTPENLSEVWAGEDVIGFAGPASSSGWTTMEAVPYFTQSKIISVYENIQDNLGVHFYNIFHYNCQDWVGNRLLLLNDNFIK